MRNAIFLLAVWLAAGVSSARAEIPGAFSWLGGGNPSASASAKPAKSSSSIKMPALFTKMTSGTKRAVSNTKNMFKPKKPPKKTSGVTAVHTFTKPPQAPEQSFFGRMFHPEPAPPPKTVSEWMALPQIKP